MNKTIRKNSKKGQIAIDSAKGFKIFSLNNDFSGKWVDTNEDIREEVRKAWQKLLGSGMVIYGDGHYKARVHSNLWFEFVA